MTKAAKTIRKIAGTTPIQAGLVLGSGLSGIGDLLADRVAIPYSELKGFPGGKVSGHGRDLLIGTLGNKRVAVLTGREHYYEHGNADAMRVALETLADLGASTLLLTNSAGSLDQQTRPGDLMMISDHINYAGMNPLIGEPSDRRFVNMVNAYDPALRLQAREIGARLDISLKEGIYLWYSGPSFETVAEIQMAIRYGRGTVGRKHLARAHKNHGRAGRRKAEAAHPGAIGGDMSLRVVDRPTDAPPPKAKAPERNPGFPLDLDWVGSVRMNRSALERRAATIGTRRTVKKDWQVAWLLRAITLMDLTTLNSDDTPGRVERLCAKARHPVRQDILEGLGVGDLKVTPAAVCVYHAFVKTAVDALKGTGINVAAVSTAFPHGLAPLSTRLAEIEASVADGANEIDIVIERGMVLRGDWQALYDEVSAMRKACGDAHIKTILGTGELATQTNVAKASLVCMLAGADFIKTSTGKEKVNANLQTSLSMVRMIRWFHEETGIEIGYKPAGGIAAAKTALDYMALMKEELGTHWLEPHLFRFGASSLLTDIERQLEHGLTGHYAADYRMPMV